MTTKKTCSRCKGKGWGTWHVDYGRCFRCNGCGVTVHYTMAERVALFVARCDASLADLPRQAAELRAAYDNLMAERAAYRTARGLEPKTQSFADVRLERDLEQLRAAYRSVRAQRAAALETGRVTPQQQATYSPAFVAGVAVGV